MVLVVNGWQCRAIDGFATWTTNLNSVASVPNTSFGSQILDFPKGRSCAHCCSFIAVDEPAALFSFCVSSYKFLEFENIENCRAELTLHAPINVVFVILHW
jgi:hypothetical protein